MMILLLFSFVFLVSCQKEDAVILDKTENVDAVEDGQMTTEGKDTAALVKSMTKAENKKTEVENKKQDKIKEKKIKLNQDWQYAENAAIHSGKAKLYYHEGGGNGITICVNAGHGTKGGESVKTLCHPDGSPKVTGGTTGQGATKAVAVSSGMTFPDGTPEAKATLSLALILKDKLLDAGYNVLMIRETDDVQLDNIARTVIANNKADCHIALHYDDSRSNKGVFFISVPDNKKYRKMEPVASHWKEHQALGEAVVGGIHKEGFKLFHDGQLPLDLTQTSYSTIPSIDLEVGDGGSDISAKTQKKIAKGIVRGLNSYYKLDKK